MKKLLAFLRGRKTYFIVGAGAIVFVLARLGVIEPDLEVLLYTALGIGGVGTMAAKVNRIKK